MLMVIGGALIVVGAGLIFNNETLRGFVHFFDRSWVLDGSHTSVERGRLAVRTMIVSRIAVLLGIAILMAVNLI